jgi:hypothetical protein
LPFRYTHIEYGAYAVLFRNAGPQSGSRMYPLRAALPPPAPRRGSLLRDADHHDPEAPLRLRRPEVPAGDLLLDITLLKAHHRDLVLDDEPLDRADVLAADPPQDRGRGDREPAIQQKPDHLKLGLQPRHVRLKEQPVDRPDLERDVIGE